MSPRFLDRIPYARFMGFRVEREGDGLVCVLPFKDEIVGNARLPAVHGGASGAGAADTRGRAEIVKLGRRIANVRVQAWQDDPKRPVAAGIGNFLL